jgi:hypothetical protein
VAVASKTASLRASLSSTEAVLVSRPAGDQGDESGPFGPFRGAAPPIPARWIKFAVARSAGWARQHRSWLGQPTDTDPGGSSAPRYGRPGVTPIGRSEGTSPHRRRWAPAERGATGVGPSRRESRDGGWRRSASTTPAESTRARMARMTCSGSEAQASQRRASRASIAVKSRKTEPGSRC